MDGNNALSTPTDNINFMDIDEYDYEEVFEETLTDELLAAHQKRITTFFAALGKCKKYNTFSVVL